MPFEAEPAMFMYFKHAFLFVRFYVFTKVKHVLRNECEVEVLSNVEVVAHPALDGRAPTLQAVARVGILLHIGVVKTMPHNEVWFHELGEGLILERIVHDRPANVRILSVALATYARSEVIGKPLGIDAVVELQAELTAHTRTHILPAAVVKGADGGAHA